MRITDCNNQENNKIKCTRRSTFRLVALLVASVSELQVTETPVCYLPIMQTG